MYNSVHRWHSVSAEALAIARVISGQFSRLQQLQSQLMTNAQAGNGYSVPAAFVEIENDVKKSRFIARIHHAINREAALQFVEQARQDYPDARHHCWAYIVGSPRSPQGVAQSDDGEPGGTAGKPILNVLEHKRVGDIVLIVIRYFGGIKLGAGGLVRAYSQAAQLAMEKLTVEEKVQWGNLVYSGDFSQEQPLRNWLQDHGGEVVEISYAEGIVCIFRLPLTHLTPCRAYCSALGGELKSFN